MALKKKTSWIPPSKEVQEELFIFGYSCTLFRDDEKALYLDQGKHLIPWMGNESVKIDRYDCRGALHDVRRFVAPPGGYDRFEGLTAEEKRIEELCDEERYMALYKDEDEEALYHEEEIKRLQQELSKDPGYAMVGFSYDEPGNSLKKDEEDSIETPIEGGKVYLDDTYVPPPDLDVPPGMAVPPTKKLNAIIQRTAVFIAKQGRQMEIVLKTKQAKNPQFGFLNFDHPLHPFYCHVIKMVQGGKYEPPPEEEPPKPPPAPPVKAESEHSDDESDGDDHYLHPSLLKGAVKQVPASRTPEPVKEVKQEPLNQVPLSAAVSKLDETSAYGQLISRIKSHHRQPEKIEAEAKVEPVKVEIIEPTGELKVIIDKLASYVAKNGRDFEEIVKAKNDPRFDFIKADHMYRPYYDSKVVKYKEMVKGSEPSKKAQEEKRETTKKEVKTIAPISFKLKPKEAEPVKLVPSSIQLGADELEDGEEPVEEEQAEKPRTKQAVSINHAFISKVRPVEAEKSVEVVSGGFGVMKPSKDEAKAESPEPMELDSSSESEEEPESPKLPEPESAPVVQSPVKKPPKPKPLDIFAEEEQAEKPATPPPESKKTSLSIEEYKNRMLKRLNSSLVVESTVETVEVVRPVESRRRKEEGEHKVIEPTRESPVRDRPQSRGRPSESDSELESGLDGKSSPSSSSTSSDESDEEKLRKKLLREKRKLALSKWRAEIRSEADESSKLAEVASPPSPVRQKTPSVEDRISPPASPVTPPDSEEQERLLRQRLEEKHRAAMQAQSNADEEKKKIERKQKAALLLEKLKKEDKLPAVQSLPNLPEHDTVVLSQPQSAPSTPVADIAMPSSLPASPFPPPEVLTVESDEDIQIIGAIPGRKLVSRKRTSSPSEDGEISSGGETRSTARRERSVSSSSSASRRKSRSRSRHRSKDRSKKKKRDRSKKDKKKRRKESSKHSSTSRSDRGSKHRKTKRRRKSDDESEERRRDDKKRRRKEKRKRRSSSSSSSSSTDDEGLGVSRTAISAPLPLKDTAPSADVLDEDSSSIVTSSVVQPTVVKLTEDLRAKVRALISSKPIQ